MFKTVLSEGVTASVDGRDGSVHLLSVTLPPHMGGGHLNTLMLNALQPQAETPPPPPPPPPKAEPAPEAQPAHAVASGESPTPVEPQQPAVGTGSTANAAGSPVEPQQLTSSTDVTADATGSMQEDVQAAVFNGWSCQNSINMYWCLIITWHR